MGKKGQKSLKGKGDLWDEVKTRATITVTPTALSGLDAIAKRLNLSRSELIERIGRGIIPLESSSYVDTENSGLGD